MLLVGLTGGIGSGKSALAAMLERRGAVVFDADQLARRAIDRGTVGYERVVERFGDDVLAPDRSIDREALAARVFADEEARRSLEAIVHPEVFRLFSEGVAPYRGTDTVVVLDAPLIVETGFYAAVDVLVVVTTPAEERVARLMEYRGMTEDSARSRIAAQAPEGEKARHARFTIVNDGRLEDLDAKAQELWEELRAMIASR